MRFAHSDILDGGLNAIKNSATRMLLVKAYSSGDSYATVTSNELASATMASGDYTLSSAGNNRVLTTASGKSATASASSNQYATGTATAGASTTITDSGKSWSTNEHAGRSVIITAGTGSGQYRRISSNTGTALTVTEAWATTPDNTSQYKIMDDLHFAFTDGSAKVLYVTDESSKQVVTSGNTVTFPQLTYTSQQPTA